MGLGIHWELMKETKKVSSNPLRTEPGCKRTKPHLTCAPILPNMAIGY